MADTDKPRAAAQHQRSGSTDTDDGRGHGRLANQSKSMRMAHGVYGQRARCDTMAGDGGRAADGNEVAPALRRSARRVEGGKLRRGLETQHLGVGNGGEDSEP